MIDRNTRFRVQRSAMTTDTEVSAYLSQYLNRPVTIQNRLISPGIVLAPLAGLGHIAFRQLVGEYGGFGLLFTGMCNAKAIPHENPKKSQVFSWRKEELPYLVCQIFGSEPEAMALAARRIEKEGFFGVDLNFGCSVAAICKKGSGAELLKHPDQCSAIVRAVRNAVNCPVFVKYRTGWLPDPEFAVGMARRFEDAGADALVFHPRVAPDRRTRPPQWPVIGDVVKAVSIPVFGNGNLFTPADGLKMFETTGCQGLSVGRMAVARPWLFSQWSEGTVFSEEIYQNALMRFTWILADHFEDTAAVKLFKKFLPYFCANFKFGHQILKQLMRGQSIQDIRDEIESIFAGKPAILKQPNRNLMT